MSNSNPRSVSVTRTFHLLQSLGEGAMGQVYEAVDPELGQRIAVKMLHSAIVGDSEVRDRFVDEAKIMAAIDHPGNLPVYGHGVDAEGRPFYAMKKVSGRTLGDLLAERGERATNLSWLARLLEIFEEVCDTVACAHEVGIVHRDLKPENILVDEERGAVYVIDWGIAKRVASSASSWARRTVDGAVIGSPGYLSPEQARGDSAEAGPPADVFALGVILYQILTASQPFAGASMRESMLRAIHRNPQDPRRLNFWVSRSVAAVCRRALEKDPNRRYPTARTLAADVHAFREGRRVSVTRQSLFELSQGWARRRPGLTALTLAMATTLLILVVIVGAQVWIDQELAEKAFESIAVTDAQIADINRQLRTLTQDTELDEPERKARRRDLVASRLVQQLEAMILLNSVSRLRFIRTSREVHSLGPARGFEALESLIREGEPELAKAFAEASLSGIETGTTMLDYSPNDVERLQALLAEAEAAMGLESAEPE